MTSLLSDIQLCKPCRILDYIQHNLAAKWVLKITEEDKQLLEQTVGAVNGSSINKDNQK